MKAEASKKILHISAYVQISTPGLIENVVLDSKQHHN
jgi:hypothetical protein